MRFPHPSVDSGEDVLHLSGQGPIDHCIRGSLDAEHVNGDRILLTGAMCPVAGLRHVARNPVSLAAHHVRSSSKR